MPVSSLSDARGSAVARARVELESPCCHASVSCQIRLAFTRGFRFDSHSREHWRVTRRVDFLTYVQHGSTHGIKRHAAACHEHERGSDEPALQRSSRARGGSRVPHGSAGGPPPTPHWVYLL